MHSSCSEAMDWRWCSWRRLDGLLLLQAGGQHARGDDGGGHFVYSMISARYDSDIRTSISDDEQETKAEWFIPNVNDNFFTSSSSFYTRKKSPSKAFDDGRRWPLLGVKADDVSGLDKLKPAAYQNILVLWRSLLQGDKGKS